jgi:hypothetical protein
MICCKGI